MIVKPRHRHVDSAGMTYLPYLSSWSAKSSSLRELVSTMCKVRNGQFFFLDFCFVFDFNICISISIRFFRKIRRFVPSQRIDRVVVLVRSQLNAKNLHLENRLKILYVVFIFVDEDLKFHRSQFFLVFESFRVLS